MQEDLEEHVEGVGALRSPYEPFFLRSAQRFFINIDNRFLPAAVIPPCFFFLRVAALGAATLFVRTAAVLPRPTNAAMARPIRSPSFRKSDTIAFRSTVRSSGWPTVCAPPECRDVQA